jgi:hydroxymethylpyrimidine pyrophosphatase-like HAD family hydrolase
MLGVKYEEIIGVGDSYNDYSLLMASGLKVAMGNAVKELKDVADYIAPSVDEDGLAEVIERYII